MSKAPVFPPGYLDSLAEFCFPPAPARNWVEANMLLARFVVGTAAFATGIGLHLLAYGGCRLLRRIRRHALPPPEPHPAESLRGTPAPEDLVSAWAADPRTLSARLRIGSRLADLEPTLDSRFVFRTARGGSRRIVARQPGVRGWMRKNVPGVTYSTAMHYKKLATRLRQAIGLDPRIPLEWLLPDGEEGRIRLSALPDSDREAAAAAASRLAKLLAEYPKVTRLARAVEARLGIRQMVTIRRVRPRTSVRRRKRGARIAPRIPLMPRMTLDGWTANAAPERMAAFRDAVCRVLGERNPDAETRKLQSDIRDWLAAPLQDRRVRLRSFS